MKIIRFESASQILLGQPLGNGLARVITGDLLGKYTISDQTARIDRLLCPIIPTDILCIGLNYRAHAEETKSVIPDHPMLFIKASNTLNHPNSTIQMPALSKMIDYEAELCVVIGKTATNVSRENALDYVLGYTCANDVSARDWQREKALSGGQFCRGKSFDGFCPIGPWIVTKDEIPNPNALSISCKVNGETRQSSSTSDMIFDVPGLIASLSSTMTLRPGAVILTGTPSGVGMARNPPTFLTAGDKVIVEIEKIGQLETAFV